MLSPSRPARYIGREPEGGPPDVRGRSEPLPHRLRWRGAEARRRARWGARGAWHAMCASLCRMTTATLPLPANPAMRYASPDELAEDDELSLERRVRLLRRWQVFLMQRERAAAAGMDGEPRTSLRSVAQALRTVKEMRRSTESSDPKDVPDGRRPRRPIGTLIPVLASAIFTLSMVALLFLDATPLAVAAAGVGVFTTAILWIALRRSR